jgi:hypothetical protein
LFFGKRVPELRFARIDRVGEQRRKGAVEWGGGDHKPRSSRRKERIRPSHPVAFLTT